MWKSNDPDEKKILYVQTHGRKDPERTATPFFLATAAAAMDNEVCIYFTMNGPQCLAKGAGDEIVVPKAGGGGKELKFFIDQAVEWTWACACSSANLRLICMAIPWKT